MAFGTYRQYDSRWGKKNYNGSSNYATAACGPTSCANILYAINPKITPLTTGKYMQTHGYAIRNNGTLHAGIPACLKHFGAQNVGQVIKMADVFARCAKGDVGVFLFGAGSKGGVTWTTSGHYIAVTGYKASNGKHYFRTFDSGGRRHDGWYCYEKTMKGLIPKIWLCKAERKKIDKPTGKYSGTIPAPTLKIGSSGAGVIALQKFLNWYHPAWKLDPDGKFGNKTENALVDFQYAEGLTDDGIYGKKSQARAKTYWQVTSTPTKPVAKPTATTTTTAPAPTTTTKTTVEKVVDVSYSQSKTIDWKKVKASGIKGAIIRCGYRGYVSAKLQEDSMFMNHIKGAEKAGLKLGIYFFTEAINAAEGKAEAQYAIKLLKKAGVKLSYPIAVDTENVTDRKNKPRANSDRLSKAKRTEAIKAFCEEIKANGYEPMIYASTSWFENQLDMSKLPYKLWVAQYASKCTYKGSKILWQYTSKAKVGGITGNVDVSYSYGTFKAESTPTTTAPAPKTETKTTTTPTVEKKTYTGKLPSLNTNAKIVNGIAYRCCYPYGTKASVYKYNGGKPKAAYKEAIDDVFPDRSKWSSKRQRAGACCDILVAVALRKVGIKAPKDLKNQLKDFPSYKSLKSNGHHKAADFRLGDIVQRGRKDYSGHTWIVCELVNGHRYVANAHYKHLKGCYAVMDAKPKTIDPKDWKYYKCYTVQGAIRTYYKKGDYGYDVLYAQKFLTWYGIECTADGDFGAKTEEAVRKYQEKRKLTVDGIIGEKTIADMKTFA